MKVVILAGGLGTRISEESNLRPKPMIEIGGKPILWHIMKQYSAHGIHDFVICLGYKGYAIKDFVAIGEMVRSPVLLVTSGSSRFRSLSELIAAARKNPEQITYGSSGIGTTNHLAVELLARPGNA